MIAKAFGGLATPPFTFKTSLVNMNVHLPCFSHSAANSSKQNISPIGIPNPASKVGCIASPGDGGQDSKPGQSPATAAIFVSQSQPSTSRVDSKPGYLKGDLCMMLFLTEMEAASKADVKPVRRLVRASVRVMGEKYRFEAR